MFQLRKILEDAARRKVAVGHFNISDAVALEAIFEAAQKLGVPVMIGVSEGEREFLGVEEAVALVKSIREKHDFPIFLNADHTHSLDRALEAAKAGFDEVLFDASKSDFETDLIATKDAVSKLKAVDPELIVEGEIGYIGSSSEIMKEAPAGAATLGSDALTTPEQAARFVKETGVDALAPAVGNMHGLLTSMVHGDVKKRLDIERIRAIHSAVPDTFLTLHGGSGTADEDFKAAIEAGINIIHINTEIRLAWREGVEAGLKARPDEVAPYKIMPEAKARISEIVSARLKLFNGLI